MTKLKLYFWTYTQQVACMLVGWAQRHLARAETEFIGEQLRERKEYV